MPNFTPKFLTLPLDYLNELTFTESIVYVCMFYKFKRTYESGRLFGIGGDYRQCVELKHYSVDMDYKEMYFHYKLKYMLEDLRYSVSRCQLMRVIESLKNKQFIDVQKGWERGIYDEQKNYNFYKIKNWSKYFIIDHKVIDEIRAKIKIKNKSHKLKVV